VVALLLCGCGTTAPHAEDVSAADPGVGTSIRSDDCRDWRRGSIAQRHTTIVELRNFAASAVGSSQGLKHGHVLDDGRAYTLMQSVCANHFARGFKLYKLYERAAAFVGH